MANPISRRDFFRQSACSAVGYTALTSAILDLWAVNAAAQDASDYKALVCVFLAGGNDASNVFLPRTGGSYAAYANLRGSLALPSETVLPLNPQNPDGVDYGLHPSLVGLQTLFHEGHLAVMRNVGTLVAPTTRADYLKGGALVPPQLFSHNDQQVLWQTSVPDHNVRTGWGGRMADLLRSLNSASQVSMLISLAGTNTFQIGREVFQYPVGSSGSVSLSGFNRNAPQDPETRALTRLMRTQHENLFENVYGGVMKRAVDSDLQIRGAFDAAPALATVFPNTRLAGQLKTAARMIQIRGSLAQRRQIFFVQAGGYDTHDDQLVDHANLLQELGDAMQAFYRATQELGVATQVTTFTGSDFGRTFTSNGRGTDHGWGSHHFVMGGAVRGGRFYGRFPNLTIKGPDDTDRGRWIPSMSVDEYSATLATWFGVSDADMPLVLPNIGHFAARNVGFMM
jgi:uncharacterized protein (DUF1501 family)